MVNLCCGKAKEMPDSESQADDGDGKLHGFWHFRSFRLHLATVLCCAMLANSLVRNTLSMAMVCMVNTTALAIADAERDLAAGINSSQIRQSMIPESCDAPDLISSEYDGSLTWSSSEQGLLFSAIYWGGALSGLPAGWLANRYSPKFIVLACFVLLMAGCMLSPLAAVIGIGIVPMFAIRFIMGIGGQAVLNPAITVIIARWIPKEGRSTVLALYTAGNQIAMIIGMPLNAYLCQQKRFLGGWPSIFYVNGFCILIAAALWYMFVEDKPSKSRWMSKAEREYIERALGTEGGGRDYNSRKQITSSVPWTKLLSSMALWSCVFGAFGNGVMATTLGSYIPTYYKEALHFDLKKNGVLSAVPYLAQWTAKIMMAVLADYLKSRTKFSHSRICKAFNCFGTFAVAAFLVAAGHTDCSQTGWAVFYLTAANGFFSAQIPGFFTSLLCIAPAYTGIVNGIARFAGQISAVISPYVVGLITVHGTASEWRLVFYIMAGVLAASGVHFIIFGTVEVQEWAKTGSITKGDVDVLHGSGREMKPLRNGAANGVSKLPVQTFQLPDLVKATEIGSLLPAHDHENVNESGLPRSSV